MEELQLKGFKMEPYILDISMTVVAITYESQDRWFQGIENKHWLFQGANNILMETEFSIS